MGSIIRWSAQELVYWCIVAVSDAFFISYSAFIFCHAGSPVSSLGQVLGFDWWKGKCSWSKWVGQNHAERIKTPRKM